MIVVAGESLEEVDEGVETEGEFLIGDDTNGAVGTEVVVSVFSFLVGAIVPE